MKPQAVISLLALGCTRDAAPPTARTGPPADFVDEASCERCHAQEVAAWRGTDHDLAWQPANEHTVLGDFADATFDYRGVTSRFFRRDGRYFVHTDGPDGKEADFAVAGVFGVDPLQQLLIELPHGRTQALSIAWDVPGRRWFHLYPNEPIDHRDELHWTRPALNWNFMCAECHATNLARNFDVASNSYRTTWSRDDVGCQACHGPASRHLAWSEHESKDDPTLGLEVVFANAPALTEVETCARCHARRAPLGDGFEHGSRLMDDYLPSLLDEGLYHADGQIQDEVYEYGSFLQSKMHAAGLRCSTCHDPHGLKPGAPGNQLCVQCHSPAPSVDRHGVDTSKLKRKDYDSPEHHFHEQGKRGSFCVDCHAPPKTYMQVDPRRDHSFRVPRPDLGVKLGTPDACTSCHADHDAQWSADLIMRWYGQGPRPEHYGETLAAARRGAAGTVEKLTRLVQDSTMPAIVRATALSLFARYPGASAARAAMAGLGDPDPLVRRAAVEAALVLPPGQLAAALTPRLTDSVRAVRIEAARQLAPLGQAGEALRAALAEFESVQRELFDRPDGHLNLGSLYADLGRLAEAEAEFRAALRVDPAFVPALANLVEVVRNARGETEAETILREALSKTPDSAILQHALGLTLIRQRRNDEALQALERAVRYEPSDARFAYVYAVALHDVVSPEAARIELERILALHPADRDARMALAEFRREAGDAAGAERTLRELLAINPDDVDARALLERR